MTEKNTFFSIIIPLYNKEKFIYNTLKSVLNQNFKDFDVWIIDDGSTDKSAEIVKQFEDKRIRYIKNENQGVSVARNTGMQLSKSPYIAFLDADDLWEENHLKSLYNLIEKFPNAGLYCSRYKTYITKDKTKKNTLIDIDDNYEGYVKDFFKSSIVDRIATSSSTCIPRHIISVVGNFDKILRTGEDLDYWIRIAIKYPVAINNSITASYIFTAENKSNSQRPFQDKTRPSFEKFSEYEKNNPSFKKFLDIYRLEYAINSRVIGDIKTSSDYLKQIDKSNISKTTKILLQLPPFFLKKMLFLKKKLRSLGIDFTIYH